MPKTSEIVEALRLAYPVLREARHLKRFPKAEAAAEAVYAVVTELEYEMEREKKRTLTRAAVYRDRIKWRDAEQAKRLREVAMTGGMERLPAKQRAE